MQLLNNRTGIKIRTVSEISWSQSSVSVSPRPFHALALRTKGSGILTVGEQKITVNPGEILYMPANCSYYADYFGETNMIAIHFDSDFDGQPEVFKLPLFSLFKKCHDIWAETKDGYYFEAMAVFYEILGTISKSFDECEFPDSFSTAVEYLKENFTDPSLNVDTLIKISNMSDTYFRRLFIKKYGETPAKHLMKLRLEYAENLLMSGKHTVNEVSYLSGFNDPKYFSRAIKKSYGVSPSKLFINKRM